MKVSLNWLRELVELPPTVDGLVDLLTLAGVEVEGIENHGVDLAQVVVGRIVESVQHPNADRLSVCQVDDGTGTARQIVCGAKNFKVGDQVPLALPGAVLPGDFKIKVGKLRGVESQGMLCSTEELGLPKGEDGLLILGSEPTPGTPIGKLFPADTILELEITPNRPDLLSVNGIAREIGSLTNKPVRLIVPQEAPILAPELSISVENFELCPFYSARAIRGVTVAPSPEWLRNKLEAVGLRPINNIVDITNLVMLELGQPLHAFDSDTLHGSVRVRSAREGEELLALDGKVYRLGASHLVIGDEGEALALAGIMGGQKSGVSGATINVILESAYFEPKSIRRSSRQLGLSSDSSYRFERGVDRCGVLVAAQRATELILQVAGGTAATIQMGAASMELMSGTAAAPIVSLRASRLEQILGIAVAPERVEQILTGFGLSKVSAGWQVPSFRADLSREIDLIEEVARVVGMDVIPARTQARFVPASSTDRSYDFAMTLRRACVSQGLHEARSLTLIPAAPLGLAALKFDPAGLIRVKNPMIDDQVVLRPHLLHGLLKAVGDNARANAQAVRLFEIGRVFASRKPEESSHLAIVLSGAKSDRTWRTAEGSFADIFDLKGIVSAILGPQVSFAPEENPALALCLSVKIGDKSVGSLGQLWPAEARQLDALAPVLFAELDLGQLARVLTSNLRYREIPRFPAMTRDIALLAPLELSHARIEQALLQAKEPLLTEVELFDLFTDPSGLKLPADRKSLAYSLTYRSSERTLTADEVNAAHGRLKERLKAELAVALRE